MLCLVLYYYVIDLIGFLESSVEKATLKKYKISWNKWKDFLSNKQINDWFLDTFEFGVKIKTLLSFIKFLYTSNSRINTIQGIITGIRQMFLFNLRSVEIFDNHLLKQGIKSTKYKTTEIVKIAKNKKENGIIPFNTELLEQLRSVYYLNDVWVNVEDFNHKAVYLAVAICLDTGVRISSVTLRDGKDKVDHCIKLSHVTIKVKSSTVNIKGEEFKSYYHSNNLCISDVELIDLYFYSDKVSTNAGIVLNRNANVIARTNTKDSQLVDDIINWILNSGVNGNDELLTRYYNNRRKVVTRKEVTDGLQFVAELNGIPKNRINTRSLRKGYATIAALSGLSESDLKNKGNWSSFKVANLHYTSNFNNNGLLSFHTGNEFGLEELNRVL